MLKEVKSMEDMFAPEIKESGDKGRYVRLTWDTNNEAQKAELQSLIKALNSNGKVSDIKGRLGKLGQLLNSGYKVVKAK